MKKKNGKLGLHVLVVSIMLLAGFFACIAFVPSGTLAQSGRGVITIDAPGAINTVVTAINDRGVIAGFFFGQSASDRHSFVRSPDGTFVLFDSPLGGEAIPASINNAGVITGLYLDGSFGAFGGSHGFVRTPDGTLTSFDAPINPANPSPGTTPYSINAAGQIAGQYYTCDPEESSCTDGFLRQPDGTMVTFAAPNGEGSTWVQSINESGTIAGYFVDLTNFTQHGFLRAADGTFTIFDAPGSLSTSTTAINSTGEIAGNFINASGQPHNFLQTRGGGFTSFDPPGACAGTSRVNALNDRGTVAGTFNDCFHSYSYTFVFLRFADGTFTSFLPGFSSGYRVVAGMNSSNSVVGTYQDANGALHGYLRPGNPGN